MLARGVARQPVAVRAACSAGAAASPSRDEVLAELDWLIDRAVEHLGDPTRRALAAQGLPLVRRARLGADRHAQRRAAADQLDGRGPRALLASRGRPANSRLEAARGPPRGVATMPRSLPQSTTPMPRDVILTQEGLDKLKDELELLATDKRREVAERIKEAREFGDIAENSEYDDAKNEQAMLEQRIAQLEEQAALGAGHRRRRTSPPTSSASARSSTSRTRRPASRQKFTIVGSAEANPADTSSPTSRRSAAR